MKNRNKAIIVASLVGAVNSYATCSVPSNGATAGYVQVLQQEFTVLMQQM
mgnify:CR=1 FL=1